MPLWAMGKAGISSGGKEAQLASALLQRLVEPGVLKAASPMDLALSLYALGKLRENWQQRGVGWDPVSVSPHISVLADAIKGRLTTAFGHG